ncbi:MAG: hypothetical protein R3E60_06915 [Alphaproteobacteria bacterium]
MTAKDKIRWSIGVQRLAEVIGPPAAMRLVETFGGGEDYFIPKRPGKTHLFLEVLTPLQLKALCGAFGPGYIEIPRGAYRNLAKARILDAKGPSRLVARQERVCQRYVRKVRSEVKAATNQLSLFDKK